MLSAIQPCRFLSPSNGSPAPCTTFCCVHAQQVSPPATDAAGAQQEKVTNTAAEAAAAKQAAKKAKELAASKQAAAEQAAHAAAELVAAELMAAEVAVKAEETSIGNDQVTKKKRPRKKKSKSKSEPSRAGTSQMVHPVLDAAAETCGEIPSSGPRDAPEHANASVDGQKQAETFDGCRAAAFLQQRTLPFIAHILV